ncbi:DNA gyrase subunit B [Devosia algicola]|uniref:DNA gyrase subunit B n=1 Tax=Devosia algicola TaxID=3026418 RepID=A0ABY7YSI5_9HYPH|nr:DNA gyrase subunit B [Devosia algicola]WDR04142.1 DNA gyrase subunit B [Devosia algicola]
MATTSDLAKAKTARTNATEREQHLEDQIAQLQTDLKEIASTLTRISGDKVSEAKHTAKAEYSQLRRQGQHVVEEVQDQATNIEKQLKDTIRDKPLTAVASAIGIGFILALLSRS